MPIKIKTDLSFGSLWYLRTDVDQYPHVLIGVVILPGNQVRFRLSHCGDEVEVYDFEASPEPRQFASSDQEGE